VVVYVVVAQLVFHYVQLFVWINERNMRSKKLSSQKMHVFIINLAYIGI